MAGPSIIIPIFLTEVDEATGLLRDKNHLNSVVFHDAASQGQTLTSGQVEKH